MACILYMYQVEPLHKSSSETHTYADVLGFQDLSHTFTNLGLPLRGAIYWNAIVSLQSSSSHKVRHFFHALRGEPVFLMLCEVDPCFSYVRGGSLYDIC